MKIAQASKRLISSRAREYLPIIDTPSYERKKVTRLNLLKFFRYYYTGEIYRQTAIWRMGNSYSPSVEPPSIYINLARLIVDRLATFSFDRVIGVSLADEVIPVKGDKTSSKELSPEGNFLSKFLDHTRILDDLTSIVKEVLISEDCALKLLYSPNGSFPLNYSYIPAEAFDYEHAPDNVSETKFVREERTFEDVGEILIKRVQDTYPNEIVTYKEERMNAYKNRTLTALSSFIEPIFSGSPHRNVELRIPNPFGFIPIVHLANRKRKGEKFGISELQDITPILDDINWKVTQRSRNISRSMNAIIKNINGRLVHDRFDDTQIISVLGEGAELEYLVNPSNLDPVERHIADLKQTLTELTGVVMLSPDKLTSIGALSGFALSILYEPLINAGKAKRQSLGTKVEQFLSMALKAGKASAF